MSLNLSERFVSVLPPIPFFLIFPIFKLSLQVSVVFVISIILFPNHGAAARSTSLWSFNASSLHTEELPFGNWFGSYGNQLKIEL